MTRITVACEACHRREASWPDTGNLAERERKEAGIRFPTILLGTMLVTTLGILRAEGEPAQKPPAGQAGTASGKETFLKYCASCHGEDGRGNGPAATALKPPPSDLTTLSKRHEGKYPEGYVSALVKFGRNLAAHGSLDMPVWGSRFKELDPVRDPTGQQHVDEVVAYIRSLQAK
jgi:mono/diheme cytochrome c family protein